MTNTESSSQLLRDLDASDVSIRANEEGDTLTLGRERVGKNTSFQTDVEDGRAEPQTNKDADSDDVDEKLTWYGIILRLLGVLILLYTFVCSLDVLSNSFRLIGGETAGEIFSNNEALQNPLAGLMIGVLATVLVQSSSTSSSIVVAMVSSGILTVRPAVPIIMGANIGTSVTNTLVAVTQFQSDDIFERSFSGATVHDMFNILSVLILLPLNSWTHFLEFFSGRMLDLLNLPSSQNVEINTLNVITDPVTDMIVLVDKTMIYKISSKQPLEDGETLLKVYCDSVTESGLNGTATGADREVCPSLFSLLAWPDKATGGVLLVLSLFFLFMCLIFLVKILQSIFRGHISKVIHKTVNADFPGCLSHFTGLFAILVGVLMTILVQSSSIFTSTLTPLIGLNIITLERAYPLTLGSNIGTTVTSILAALASEGEKFRFALQIAFCHLLFNVVGILIWYPLPCLRRVPLSCARQLGKTTKNYPWFSIVYIIFMFLVLPGCIFAISLLGQTVFLVIVIFIGVFISSFIILLTLQKFCKDRLPEKFQTFKFLPEFLRSLAPYHNFMLSVRNKCFSKTVEQVGRLRRPSERSMSADDDRNAKRMSNARNASGRQYANNIKSDNAKSTKASGASHCGSGSSDVDSAQEARECQTAKSFESNV